MKKLLLASLLMFLCFYSFSQSPVIKDGTLSTTLTSGAGVDVPVKFSISNVDGIKASEQYIEFKKDDEFISGWIKKGVKDSLAIFLMSHVNFVADMIKIKMENSTSFTPIENSKGMIYISDDKKLVVSFPFKAENSLGNLISVRSYTEGKETTIIN
jgi:hypothetical protein